MLNDVKLIVTQSGIESRTQAILENEAYLKSLPIDGMSVNIPASWSLMSPGTVVAKAEVDRWLAPIAEFNAQMENNYLLTLIDRPGDLFDDTAWAQAAENFGVMAAGARDHNFKGLFFDNEEYFTPFLDIPDGLSDGERSAYENKMAERGREIMEAIQENFPGSEVGVYHGPYLSVNNQGAPDAVETAMFGQAGGKSQQELRGPFFTGMLEGKGEDQKLIDMGELYALRSETDFEQSQAYRSERLPDRIDWNIPQALRDGWADAVETSHMVYTQEFPSGSTQTPQTLATTLVNASKASGDSVFLYSDHGSLDLLTPGAAPDAYIDAIREAYESEGAVGPGPTDPASVMLSDDGSPRRVIEASDTAGGGDATDWVVEGFDLDSSGAEKTFDTLVLTAKGETHRAATDAEMLALVALAEGPVVTGMMARREADDLVIDFESGGSVTLDGIAAQLDQAALAAALQGGGDLPEKIAASASDAGLITGRGDAGTPSAGLSTPAAPVPDAARGALIHQGEEIFPVGFYGPQWRTSMGEKTGAIDAISAAGFNTIVLEDIATPRFDSLLARAEAADLGVIVGLTNLKGDGYVADTVGAHADAPAVMAWSLLDDGDDGDWTPGEIAGRNAAVKALDDAPTYLTLTGYYPERRAEADAFAALADVPALQVYPIDPLPDYGVAEGDALTEAAARMMDYARAAEAAGKPFVLNAQTFAWDEAEPQFPTADEVRNMAYAGLAAGAKGIVAYDYSEALRTEETALWDEYAAIADDVLGEAGAYYLDGDLVRHDTGDSELVASHYLHEDGLLLIVVNTSYDEAKDVAIALPPGYATPRAPYARMEDTLRLEDDAMVGTAAPEEVLVYELML